MIVQAALFAIATFQSSQSPPVWNWIPEEICALRQELHGEEPIELHQDAIENSVRIQLDFTGSARAPMRVEDAQIAFDSGSSTTTVLVINPSKTRNKSTLNIWADTPQFLDQLGQATKISLAHKAIGMRNVNLRAPGAALTALRSCQNKKLQQWGLDPSQISSLKSLPVPKAQAYTWFSSDDYPAVANLYRVGGLVGALLEVGVDGKVKGCRVVHNRALQEFHDAVCGALIKRGRFEPAIDSNGMPVAAPYYIKVQFALPG